MTITALPPAPSRADPVTFADKADDWVAALELFTTEANELQEDVNAKQFQVSEDAITAADAAIEAAFSAATALNAPGTQATSVTTLSLSIGSKSITLLQTGKAFTEGQWVAVTSRNATDNWMIGRITSYDSVNGLMDVDVSQFSGSISDNSWTIAPATPNQPTNNQWAGVWVGPLF